MKSWWVLPIRATPWRREVRGRLLSIEYKLDQLLKKETELMATLDDVVTKITGMSDVEDGVAAVVDQIITQEAEIKAKLDAAIAAGADPAKVQAIADQLDTQTAKLAAMKDKIAAAVAANTPAAPTP